MGEDGGLVENRSVQTLSSNSVVRLKRSDERQLEEVVEGRKFRHDIGDRDRNQSIVMLCGGMNEQQDPV